VIANKLDDATLASAALLKLIYTNLLHKYVGSGSYGFSPEIFKFLYGISLTNQNFS